MGQRVSNHEFDVDDLARVLDKGFPETWILVSALQDQHKVELDGHLIKPSSDKW